MQTRYHIQFRERRTSLMLDTILSDMLAIKLGVSPDSQEAHGVVRQWLEDAIIGYLGDNTPNGSRVSQWARYLAIQAVAAPEISEAHFELISERARVHSE